MNLETRRKTMSCFYLDDNMETYQLETIFEQSEDLVINLEKRLENYINLNQNLDEKNIVNGSKLVSVEVEKLQQIQRTEQLQPTSDPLQVKLEGVKVQLESIKAEKCNLLLKINELKKLDADQVRIVQELQSKIIINESEDRKWSREAEQINSEIKDAIWKLLDDQRVQVTDSHILLKNQIAVRELLSELQQLKETFVKIDESCIDQSTRLKTEIQLLKDTAISVNAIKTSRP